MAYLVKTLPRAERDLEEIFEYIQAETSAAANAWFGRLAQAIESLAKSPMQNPVTLEDPGLRQMLFGTKPHICRIIYAVDSSKKIVSILHVRHGARDAFSPSRSSKYDHTVTVERDHRSELSILLSSKICHRLSGPDN